MKIRRLKKSIFQITILSFVVSIAPLIVAMALKWNTYVESPSDTVKLSIGGIIVVVLILLKAMGRLKLPQQRLVKYIFLLILCYTLSAILNDIVFLLAMATLGEAVDLVCFQFLLKKLKERLQHEKQGDVVASKVETLIQQYLGEKKV